MIRRGFVRRLFGPLSGRARLTGGLAAVALCVTVSAWAATRSYTGTVREQGKAAVEFKLVRRGGEFVKPFRFQHVRLRCELGPDHIVISRFRIRRIPVVNDRFHKTRHPSDVAAAVSGQLVRHGRAHGRLTVTEDAAFCDSGILHWHARVS